MERNIVDFIENHVEEVADLAAKHGDSLWRVKKNGRPADQRIYAERAEALQNVYANRENFARVRTYDDEHLSNEIGTQRQIHLMRLRFAAAQVPIQRSERMAELVGEIDQISHTYRVHVGSKKFSLIEVRENLAESNDKKLRKALWMGARSDLGEDVGDHAIRLVGVRNRTARDLGYSNFFQMTLKLKEIDETFLTKLLNKLVSTTEAEFTQSKEELDVELRTRFKLRVKSIPPWMYGELFFRSQPAEKPLGFDKLYAGKDLAALAAKAMTSIGFDIESILAKSELHADDTKNTESTCIQVDRRRKGTRIHANIVDDESSMTMLMSDLGRAVYYENIGTNLPFLLREPSHDLILNAIGLLFAQETRTLTFLSDIVEGNKSTVARLMDLNESENKRDRLLTARWLPMIIYFERSLYDNPGRDMTRIWWDLAQIFQKIEEPPEVKGKKEWAANIELAKTPVDHQNQLLCTLIASQFRQAIEEATGMRNIVGNPGAKDFLVERIFAPGATDTWADMIEKATGRPLSVDSFVAGY
ncbi:MAG: peptidyl-dipeptidase A [Planctomycetota bacterium]|jgi:peptidyl-dipeptidase A